MKAVHDLPYESLPLLSPPPSAAANHNDNDRDDYPHGPWPCLENIFDPQPSSTTTTTTVNNISNKAAATAQAMDAVAKGVLHAATVFFGPALLQCALWTASTTASCDVNQATTDNADSRDCLLWGFWRPTSVLTTSSVLAVTMATIGIPFFGAYIGRPRRRRQSDEDHHHPTATDDVHGRYTAGRWTAFLLISLHFGQTLLQTSTWIFFWLLHTLEEALNLVHQMIILAYLQDVTSDIATLTRYSSHFALLQFMATLVFLALVVLYATRQHSGDDDDDEQAQETNTIITMTNESIRTSRFANTLAGSVGLIIMTYAWTFLFPRQKQDQYLPGSYASLDVSSEVPAIATTRRTWWQELCISGQSLLRLVYLVRRDYPSLQWLIVTLMFSPSLGSGSYISIFSTLHKVLVHMNSSQVGLVNLIALASAMLGAKIAAFVGQYLNALRSFQLCLGCLVAVFTGTAYLVHGPQDIYTYYVLLAAVGMVLGWLLPTERVLCCTLAPVENQSEIMALLVAVHTALAFIPPLLFSVITQLGYSVKWAVLSQNLLLVLAISGSLKIGSFEQAVAQARHQSKG